MPGKSRGNPRTAGKKATTSGGVTGKGVTIRKLDGDGQPIGEPVHMPDAEVTLGAFTPDDAGIELPSLAPGATVEFATDDPETVALVRDLTRIPVPTAVMASWFPAFFRPPNVAEPWRLCKVFVAPQGLYVYRQPPAEPETFTSGAFPAWYAPVDFEKTARPVAGYAARNAGIPVVTSAGTVLVQPTGGCGCAANAVKRWRPTWARTVISWEDGVKLATDATAGR